MCGISPEDEEEEEFELLKQEIELKELREAEKEIKRLDRAYISEKKQKTWFRGA